MESSANACLPNICIIGNGLREFSFHPTHLGAFVKRTSEGTGPTNCRPGILSHGSLARRLAPMTGPPWRTSKVYAILR
jgi:hypothetical protein